MYYCFLSRYGCFEGILKQINAEEDGLEKFSRGYEKFGLHVNPDNSITCYEWAPLAQGLFLKGDFSKITSYTKYYIRMIIENYLASLFCMICSCKCQGYSSSQLPCYVDSWRTPDVIPLPGIMVFPLGELGFCLVIEVVN